MEEVFRETRGDRGVQGWDLLLCRDSLGGQREFMEYLNKNY